MKDSGGRATFFIDESGNTGAYWLDPEQPIFAYGGWLVPEFAETELHTAINMVRTKYQLQGAELKWSQISRRPNRAAIFRELFERFLNGPALPFFFVADKEYQVAAKIVETYFDPAYNSSLSIQFASAMKEKKALAEILLSAPAALKEFAGWIRSGAAPTRSEVLRLGEQLSEHLANGGATQAATAISGLTESGIADLQQEFTGDAWLRSTTGHTLLALLQLLGRYLRTHNVEVEIVHDALVRYDPLFDLVRSLFREAEGDDIPWVEDNLALVLMPTVTGLRLADSRTVPLVQGADLLVGFLRTAFTKLKQQQALDTDERAVMIDLAVIHDQWFTWDANMPQTMWTAAAQVAFGGHSVDPLGG